MRAVIQRVSRADVVVEDEVVGAIERGLLVYLGAGEGDEASDVAYVAQKIRGLRVFVDEEGKMSRSVEDVGGAVLVISQFTLYGDPRSPAPRPRSSPSVSTKTSSAACAPRGYGWRLVASAPA